MPAALNMWPIGRAGRLVPRVHNLFNLPCHQPKCLLHQLKLRNTFLGTCQPVSIQSTPVLIGTGYEKSERLTALAYCCGPTVYDDSHIGHALSYIKFDLVRRFLAEYANVDLITAMNVTDIDDKIIERAAKDSSTPAKVASRYLRSFLEDLKALNVSPPHVLLEVSKHMNCIIQFIQQLEKSGKAYVNPATGDLTADSSNYPSFHSNNDSGQSDAYIDAKKSKGKRLPSDFVLWKRAKTGEPNWAYISPVTGLKIDGRPGWHVECSSLINSTLGPFIDFHFGGKDLIFPHHYNESVACNLFQERVNSPSVSKCDVTNWCKYWLHFGHVTIRGEKMSKSLGNSWYIKDFLRDHSANLLRLICLSFHYRSDLNFDGDVIKKALEIDRKLNDLVYQLQLMIDESITEAQRVTETNGYEFDSLLGKVTDEISEALANDLDFHQTLEAIESLHVYIKQVECGLKAKVSMVHLVKCKFILEKWIRATGLSYNLLPTYTWFNLQGINHQVNRKEIALLGKLQQLRNQLRSIGVQEKKRQGSSELLTICDELRNWMNKEGFVASDKPIK